MRNTVQYPVLPDEVLDILKRESAALTNKPWDEVLIGDMRPLIYRYISEYLDLNKHDFERFLLSQPANGPNGR